jgi:hypothetical protein
MFGIYGGDFQGIRSASRGPDPALFNAGRKNSTFGRQRPLSHSLTKYASGLLDAPQRHNGHPSFPSAMPDCSIVLPLRSKHC